MENLSFGGKVAIVTGVASVAALVVFAPNALFLTLAGALIGLALRGVASIVARRLHVDVKLALVLVVVSSAALLVTVALAVGPDLAAQIDDLMKSLRESVEHLVRRIQRYEWGRALLSDISTAGELIERTQAISRLGGLFSMTVDALTALVALFFLGMFLAMNPEVYLRGVLQLVPVDERPRAAEAFSASGRALRWWMLAKLVSALASSFIAALGLWLVGVPLVLVLTVLIFIGSFIPYVGAVLAAIPAVLLAWTISPKTAAWAAAFYFLVQLVDGYVISPVAERRMASLPPALTLVAQLVLGSFAGWVGVALAAPLVVLAMVFADRFFFARRTAAGHAEA